MPNGAGIPRRLRFRVARDNQPRCQLTSPSLKFERGSRCCVRRVSARPRSVDASRSIGRRSQRWRECGAICRFPMRRARGSRSPMKRTDRPRSRVARCASPSSGHDHRRRLPGAAHQRTESTSGPVHRRQSGVAVDAANRHRRRANVPAAEGLKTRVLSRRRSCKPATPSPAVWPKASMAPRTPRRSTPVAPPSRCSAPDPTSFIRNTTQSLAERIVEHGALVSEFPPGTEGRPEFFPRRNRIIAGIEPGHIGCRSRIEIRFADHRPAWRTNRAAKCSRCRVRSTIRWRADAIN